MNDQDLPEETNELRQHAEQQLQAALQKTGDLSLQDAKHLIHELHVHQIELEVQNEQLRITQLALERSNRKYSDLYEFSPVGLLTLDQEGRIQEANLTLTSMLGVDREKLLKQYFSHFIDRAAQDAYHFFYQALRKTLQPQQCELAMISANSTPLVLKVDGIALSQENEATSYRLAATDVSEQYQSEREIRRLYDAEQVARTHSDRIATRIISLQQVTASLSNANSYEQVFEICLQQSMPIIAARRGDIVFRPKDSFPPPMKGSFDLLEHTLTEIEPQDFLLAQMQTRQDTIKYLSLDEYLQSYPEASKAVLHDITTFATLPLIVNDTEIGVLNYGFVRPKTLAQEDQVFLKVIAQQCAQALERIRLSEKAREFAALHERQRLSRELHDSVKQSIFAAMIMSESLPKLWVSNIERGKAQLDQIVILNRAALAQMQVLLLELRPESIVKTPLSMLLRQLSETAQGHREIVASFELLGAEPTLPPDVHFAIYRVAQESINNVLKHSQAEHFSVQLVRQVDELTLIVRDDGIGFDAAQSSPGIGLTSMQERAAAIGATLQITNLVTGGTEVKLRYKRISPG